MRKIPVLWTALALAALSAGVSAWSFHRHFEGGVAHEFCHYAEIGRNILEGKGFRTAVVYPYALAYLDRRGVPFGPEALSPVLDRFPLPSALTAAAMAFTGANDAAPALVSILSLALCSAGVFLAGCLLFTPLEGLLAGLLFALNPSFQRAFVLWGLPDFLFCALTLASTAAFCRYLEAPRERRAPLACLAGALAGLAFLARSNYMLWLPLLLGFQLSAGRGRPRELCLFWLCLVAVSSPGWIYSLRHFGSLTPPGMTYNLAHHSAQDVAPWFSYREYTTQEVLVDHLPALIRKIRRFLWLGLTDLPFLWQTAVLFPFIVAGAWNERGRSWVRLVLGMLAVHVLVFSALRYETLAGFVKGRYLLWWAAPAVLLAMRGASSVGQRLRIPRPREALAAACLLVYGGYWLTPQGRPARPGGLLVGRWPELEAAAGRGGVVATNLPAQLAWYGRRTAIALPETPEQLLEIERKHPLSAVLISRLPVGELDQIPAWRPLLADPARLKAFARSAGLPAVSDLGPAVLLGLNP